jgi:prolyl oligopeptidase
VNGLLLVYTNYQAPRYRLIGINPENPNIDDAKEIIPETEDVLTGVSLCADRIVAQYLSNVSSKLNVLDLTGKYEKTVKLPGIGMVSGFSSDRKEKFAFYSFTSFTQPSTIYSYDIFSNTSKIYNAPKLSFNSDDFETKQVFYKSKDGTKIPMFITMKKGVTLNGNHPVYLYGYGGFNISITPGFSPQMAVFLEAGGIYAVANIRGGGEFGTEWHQNGTKLKKQNVFDDFIAAAEYLIENKYTNASKIAISGRSNGGLLIGACMTQRPDLFKVALPAVGVLDMLRYHKFTIGYAWAGDYGRSDEKDQFPNLLSYSPLHNVKPVEYPATMVLTADHDDRVVPAHSFKFAAELQSKAQGKNPILIRIDVNAGHGAGKPTSKTIDEWADIWTFTFYHLGMGLK